jgi:hypothetical protein
MAIDKNLLSKKSGQESADELFGPIKTQLTKAREQFENLVANHQTAILENIDEVVKKVLYNYNSRGNAGDTITFDVRFIYDGEYSVPSYDIYGFKATYGGNGATYKLKGDYSRYLDEDIVNTSKFSKEELDDMATNCKKYLSGVLEFSDIRVNAENKVSIFVDLDKYLIKAAHDFSQLVVAYLAKQGIKSSASQSNNKVTVVIERDTDTGGFEDI